MKDIVKSGVLISTAIAMDAAAAGGAGTLAALGISEVVKALSDSGSDVLAGLSSHFISSGMQNTSLEREFAKAFQETLQEVRQEYAENQELVVSKWQALSIKYKLGVPKWDDPGIVAKSLRDHFFTPLEDALNDPSRIQDILNKRQEIKPGEFIHAVISDLKIELPGYRKEHQEKLEKALMEGFKESFLRIFNAKLVRNEKARKAYQITLLQASIDHMEGLNQNVDKLLNLREEIHVQLETMQASIIDAVKQNLPHSPVVPHTEAANLERRPKSQLLLTTYRPNDDQPIDYRDQFRFETLYMNFQGRKAELNALQKFLAEDQHFSFYAICGPGGSGKSRLANELCLEAEKLGWYAGFFEDGHNPDINWINLSTGRDTLIVVDYVFRQRKQVRHILEGLSLSRQHIGENRKIRVLLVNRDFNEESQFTIISPKTRYYYHTYQQNGEIRPLMLPPLSDDECWAIVKQILNDSDVNHNTKDLLSDRASIMQAIHRQDKQRRPLFTFFTANALREGKTLSNTDKWNTKDNLKYHLQRIEDKFWSNNPLWSKSQKEVKNLLWLGALLEGFTEDQIDLVLQHRLFENLSDLKEDEAFWDHLQALFNHEHRDEKQTIYSGIKPDLLAEYYVAQRIEKLSKNASLKKQLMQLFECAWTVNPTAASWMTWLVFSNYLEEFKGLQTYMEWLIDYAAKSSNNIHIGGLFHNLSSFYYNQGKIEQGDLYYEIGNQNEHFLELSLHEYQLKEILKSYGLTVQEGIVVDTPEGAAEAARALTASKGTQKFVIKAQIHARGRTKGKILETGSGGVVKANTPSEVALRAKDILAGRLVTYQTAREGTTVRKVIVAEDIFGTRKDSCKDFYLCIMSPSKGMPGAIMATYSGGQNPEDVAMDHPERIIKEMIDPSVGLQGFQVRKVVFGLCLEGQAFKAMVKVIYTLYKIFVDLSTTMLEVDVVYTGPDQPLKIEDGRCALGVSANEMMKDLPPNLDSTDQGEMNYAKLDGNISCIVNGAGLAMATMEIVKKSGGEPACFIDVGVSGDSAKFEAGLRIAMRETGAKAVLINIFGEHVNCESIARNLVQACKNLSDIELPIVTRLQGINAEDGAKIIHDSGLKISSANSLEDAITKTKILLI